MYATRPSRTAQMVCLFRAAENLRPADRQIVADPFAAGFLPLPMRVLSSARARLPDPTGLSTYVLARHAALDDQVRRSVRGGCSRVVVLGAGYDSRAWRLADVLGDTPVWEVDHPATAAAKAARAASLPPVNRRVVTVDFQTQSLAEQLAAAGFTRGKSTCWIWEGVSMYLTRQAVLDSLGVMRELSGPGSVVGMDLWHYLDDPAMLSTARRMSASMLALFGEPITFGVHPSDAVDFFARAGFELAHALDASLLEQRFVPDGRHVMPECYVVGLTLSGGAT